MTAPGLSRAGSRGESPDYVIPDTSAPLCGPESASGAIPGPETRTTVRALGVKGALLAALLHAPRRADGVRALEPEPDPASPPEPPRVKPAPIVAYTIGVDPGDGDATRSVAVLAVRQDRTVTVVAELEGAEADEAERTGLPPARVLPAGLSRRQVEREQGAVAAADRRRARRRAKAAEDARRRGDL